MGDVKSYFEIIYQNCVKLVRFRFKPETQLASSNTVLDPPPENFGLSNEKFKHEITTNGYVLLIHNYLCILMTNPDRNIGSSLPAFRTAIQKAIAPRNAYMNDIKEIILITEKSNNQFLDVVTTLYPASPNPKESVLIRFVSIDIFTYNQPDMLAFNSCTKISIQDIEKHKKFVGGNIYNGLVRNDDVAIIRYGYKPGDIISSLRRSHGTIWASDIYLVI